MEKKLIIVGASGHGKVVEEIARLNGYTEIAYLDDRQKELSEQGINVIGECKDIPLYKNDYEYAVGIGDNFTRKRFIEKIKEINGKLPVLVHPTAEISIKAALGRGTCVMPMAVVNAEANIGEGCIVNTSATIDHECQLENYIHISPGVHLAGNVKIKELSWIGIGSCVIQGITIGKNSIIGAGTVVIKDIPDEVIVVGNPGKEIGKNNE